MRYILTLFLITIVSSSEIINKSDEIKEFGEYEDVELQLNLGIIPYIGKLYVAGNALCASARAFIVGSKVFKHVKGAIGTVAKVIKKSNPFIVKGRVLIEKSRIFTTAKKIFDKGIAIYNKYNGITRDTKFDKKALGTIDKVIENEIYQTYQEMRDTYNKAKDTYDKIKNYYEQYQDIYNRYFKRGKAPEERRIEYQQEEIKRKNAYQVQQQRLNTKEKKRQERLIQQKIQAFQSYVKVKNNNTMTLTTKIVEINNILNYMLNKGFITPIQKHQMSYI